ncbi:hypothetical protein LNP10_03690 [Apilactobacillus nanyangensis]|uniref:UDP-N-acetylglucosamine kinase n=1 Tax=Apilactobacillus nanyangensis TaxID=2799579 RepID=A0ABT0HXF3_9LACO|nr:hypothetical protein [Apilactobacillus nanyangensis]MCK8611598.1 hypothetical protein [Apilactobacillus nanyangensis]
MDPVLIILRGNAATGKTSVASKLQEQLGASNVMLVQPDISDKENDNSLMIKKLVEYGKKHFHYVILEGVLPSEMYKSTLNDLVNEFGTQQLVYYFSDSFERTLEYNKQKNQPHDIDKLKS